MPNIIITNICNLQCPYCFATGVTKCKPEFMTLEQVNTIINLSKKTKDSIKILGGEPTIHPDFVKIVDLVSRYNFTNHMETIIFSNGIFLYKYYDAITKLGRDVTFLINVNDLSGSSHEVRSNFKKSIDMAAEQGFANVCFGCNIHLGEENYDYIFDLIKEYRYAYNIRVSAVAPANQYANYIYDKVGYYNKIKPIILKFLRRCKENNVLINLDCNFIPRCMMSYEESKLLCDVSINPLFLNCGTVIDIDYNYDVWPCFGRFDQKINISDNINKITLDELRQKFDVNDCGSDLCKIHEPKTSLCAICQGGCKSFKEAT